MKTKTDKKCDFCNETIFANTEFVNWKFDKTPDIEKSMNEMIQKSSIDLHPKCSIRLGVRLMEDVVKISGAFKDYAQILFKTRILMK
jgi:hypothetical protein